MGAFPNPLLEPAVPCRLCTCLGAEMGLEGERQGGRGREGRPGGRLGFDWQLSSLFWACPPPHPHPSWPQKRMGGVKLTGKRLFLSRTDVGWGPSFPLAAAETGAT